MELRMRSGLLVIVAPAVLFLAVVDAFAPKCQRQQGRFCIQNAPSFVTAGSSSSPSSLVMLFADQQQQEGETGGGEEASAAAEGGEAPPAPEGGGGEEEELSEEDKEMAAIKAEIEELEAELVKKRLEFNAAEKQAESYSKAGFQRRVAEMEMMRRSRSSRATSNQYTAMAGVVQEFLPIMDTLDELNQKEDWGSEAANNYSKGYGAMSGTFKTALTKKLRAKEFTAPVGTKVDIRKHNVVEQEFSDSFEKDTIIRPISLGYELEGNIMRFANCVASKGKEGEEAAAADAAPEAGGGAEAAAPQEENQEAAE